MISVIVPAHNEEAWLPATLGSIRAAADYLRARSRVDVETIVVDNGSTDDTAAVARDRGATVIHEPVRSIGRARNTGARHASGEALVFVDADVHIPRTLLEVIHEPCSIRDASAGAWTPSTIPGVSSSVCICGRGGCWPR